jgi:hypothetical protein
MGQNNGDLGLEAVYGLSALEQLKERVRKQVQDQEQQRFENTLRMRDLALRESEGAQRARYQDAQLLGLNDQREANADLRRQRTADDLEKTRTIGDVLDPSQVKALRAANRGNDVEHQTATLPSTQYAGFATTPAAGTPTAGVLRRAELPGNPEQDVYRGNAAQRESAQQKLFIGKIIRALPENSRERLALEYRQATGANPPAGVFEPREPTPHYQFMPTYDDSGNPNGVVAGNTLTGAMTPASVPGGASIRPPKDIDNPALPRGVQDYLVKLRSDYGDDLRSAEAEFSRALPSLRAAHPRLDSASAILRLRQMFGTAPGASPLAIVAGGMLNLSAQSGTPVPGGRGAAAPRTPVAAGRPASGQLTRDELRAVAAQLGITEAEAEAQAKQRGLSVR